MFSRDKARVIIAPGKGEIPNFNKGTKVTFDFKTIQVKENGEELVIDDSKKSKKPMEMLIGKEFKLKVWEECIKTMRVGEISKFTVHKSLLLNYPFVSQTYRKFAKPKSEHNEQQEENSHRCCGLQMNKSTNYADLDDLITNPTDLQFVIELLKVENSENYEKEVWQMEEDEKHAKIPQLKEEGNKLYNEHKYEAASEKYALAVAIIDQLMSREKPGDEQWVQLDKMKVPLLSNYSQCKLLLEDYYSAIEHSTEVIKRDPRNVKAYYRRAKAHSKVWNVEEAKDDFRTVLHLDNSLEKSVSKQLKLLEDAVKEKERLDKERLKGKLFG